MGSLARLTEASRIAVAVEPALIAEVETDAATDEPFERPRHGVTLVRIRPDLHPRDLPRV